MSAVRARVRDPKTGRFMASAANISAESASPTVLHESFSPSVFNVPPERRPPLSALFEEETPDIFPQAERTMAGNNNEWALKMFASRNKGLIRNRDDIETFVNAGSPDQIDNSLVSSLREFHPCATNLFDQLCKMNPRVKAVTDSFRSAISVTSAASVVRKEMNTYFHKLLSQAKADHYTALMFTILVLAEKRHAQFESDSVFVFARRCLRLVREYAFTEREELDALREAVAEGKLPGKGDGFANECVSNGPGFNRMLVSNAELCTDSWGLWEILEDYMGFESVAKDVSAEEAYDLFWISEDPEEVHSNRQAEEESFTVYWERFWSRYDTLGEAAQMANEPWRLKMENDLVENFRRGVNRKYWSKMVSYLEEKEWIWRNLDLSEVGIAVRAVEMKVEISAKNFKAFKKTAARKAPTAAVPTGAQGVQKHGGSKGKQAPGSIKIPCRYGSECRRFASDAGCPFLHDGSSALPSTVTSNNTGTAVVPGAQAEFAASDGVMIDIPKPKNRFGSRRTPQVQSARGLW